MPRNHRHRHLPSLVAAAALAFAGSALAADTGAKQGGDGAQGSLDIRKNEPGAKPKRDAEISPSKSGTGTGDTARSAPDIRENEPGAKPRRDAETGAADSSDKPGRDERVSMIEGSKASGTGEERPLGNDPKRSIEGLKPKWDADVKKGS
ncbi:MAG: hypothetical protein AB7P21_09415 [Lautropia sp.]